MAIFGKSMKGIAKKVKKQGPKAVKVKTLGLKSQMKQIGKKTL